MSIKERKEQEKRELRKKILNASKEILFEKGIENLTMRAIADKVDYSPTTIYLYFKNKEELVTNLLEFAFEQLVIALASIDRDSFADDPVSMLKEGLRVYMRHGTSNPSFYRMMTTSVLRGVDDSVTLREGTMNERAFSILELGIQNCIDAGVIHATNATVTATLLWAAIHGMTMLLIDKPDFPWGDTDSLMNAYVDLLVDKL